MPQQRAALAFLHVSSKQASLVWAFLPTHHEIVWSRLVGATSFVGELTAEHYLAIKGWPCQYREAPIKSASSSLMHEWIVADYLSFQLAKMMLLVEDTRMKVLHEEERNARLKTLLEFNKKVMMNDPASLYSVTCCFTYDCSLVWPCLSCKMVLSFRLSGASKKVFKILLSLALY